MTRSLIKLFRSSRIGLLLAASLWLFTGCPQKSQNYQNPLLGYFKAPAPKVLADKSLGLIRELDSSGQAALFIPFLLGGYGHPSYTGIDPELDIAVFGFQTKTLDDTGFLILIKAERDAQLIEQLLGESAALVREWGPWLAITNQESVFDLVVSKEELQKIATTQSNYDFELTLLPQAVGDSREDLMADLLASPELQENQMARIWAEAAGNTFFDEIESAQNLILGANLSEETIGWGMDLTAKRGSPLGSLISAGSPGRVEGGKFLAADQSVTYVMDYPVGAIRNYLEHLMENLKAQLPENDPTTLQLISLHEEVDQFLEDWSGLGGGGYSLEGGKVQSQQILLGEFESDPVEAYFQDTRKILVPLLQKAQENEEAEELKTDFSFTPNAGEISGVSYHWIHQSFEMPESPSKEESSNPLPEDLVDQDIYFAVVEDHFIQVSTLEALETLILNVQKGGAGDDSISTRFSERKNIWFQGHLDLINYYLETMESIPGGLRNPLVDTEELAQALDALKGRDLEPVSMTLSNEGSRVSARMELPVSTLKAAVEAFQNFEPERGAEEMAPPSDSTPDDQPTDVP